MTMLSSSTSRPAFRALLVVGLFGLATACRNVEESHNPLSDSLANIGATAPADQNDSSGELSRVQFDDIPCPPGFSFRNHRNESFSFADGGVRLGRFVYWTRKPADEARTLYLEFMGKDPYNWALVSSPDGSRNGPWVFEKNGERCEVTTGRLDKTPEGETLVTVTVGRHRDP
ncbi:MAG: hypothetical protein H6807_13730 [Planctomycetes bacterium]|nr:hypothetical protein [Planctomycetota bacterium]